MADGPAEIASRFVELWNGRAMHELYELLDPSLVQRDHRPLTDWGVTREDWRALTEGWWAILPDARLDLVGGMTVRDDRVAVGFVGSGHDSVAGGELEVPFAVVWRIVAGRIVSTDIFDDVAAALAFLRAGG